MVIAAISLTARRVTKLGKMLLEINATLLSCPMKLMLYLNNVMALSSNHELLSILYLKRFSRSV